MGTENSISGSAVSSAVQAGTINGGVYLSRDNSLRPAYKAIYKAMSSLSHALPNTRDFAPGEEGEVVADVDSVIELFGTHVRTLIEHQTDVELFARPAIWDSYCVIYDCLSRTAMWLCSGPEVVRRGELAAFRTQLELAVRGYAAAIREHS